MSSRVRPVPGGSLQRPLGRLVPTPLFPGVHAGQSTEVLRADRGRLGVLGGLADSSGGHAECGVLLRRDRKPPSQLHDHGLRPGGLECPYPTLAPQSRGETMAAQQRQVRLFGQKPR